MDTTSRRRSRKILEELLERAPGARLGLTCLFTATVDSVARAVRDRDQADLDASADLEAIDRRIAELTAERNERYQELRLFKSEASKLPVAAQIDRLSELLEQAAQERQRLATRASGAAGNPCRGGGAGRARSVTVRPGRHGRVHRRAPLRDEAPGSVGARDPGPRVLRRQVGDRRRAAPAGAGSGF